jgi:hypothetical protein
LNLCLVKLIVGFFPLLEVFTNCNILPLSDRSGIMRFLTVSAFAAALLPLASSKSLYIDSTCTSKTGWGTYFLETQNFARRASDRMSSASDTDFKNVFNRIMKTDAGSSDGQYIKSKSNTATNQSRVTPNFDST